ncbi:MAG: hypothetical protein KTR32_43945 [Granulosicoccus sp.]|nr:hypothetical protein [Granulosicoccus sp.]
MALLTQLLRSQLSATEKSRVKDTQFPATDSPVDDLESSRPYRRWALGFRSLVRLGYLKQKKEVLETRRSTLEYETSAALVQSEVVQNLGKNGSFSLWPIVLRPLVFYPLVLAGLALIAVVAVHLWQQQIVEHHFRDSLPRYSDSVYLWKAARAENPDDPQLPEMEKNLLRNRSSLLAFHSEHPAITASLSDLLLAVTGDETTPRAMPAIVKKVNDAFYSHDIDFYISAVSEVTPCDFLPPNRFIERLFGGSNEAEGELCRTHALLTFSVDEARHYLENEQRHLTLFTRRLDGLAIDEGILGRVHIGDNTAQVLLSNIAGASSDSLRAISNGSLQAKLMPQGMTDVYGLESLARRIQANVIAEYVRDIENVWFNRIRTVWLDMVGRKANPLALASRKLEERIADVTAFHEVQHLVDQSLPLPEPPWLKDSLAVFGKRIHSDHFRKHIFWELSAFFTHLANGEELQGVLLNDFTAITLNPMLQDQPHYYSVRLLLPILHQMASEGQVSTPPVPARSLAEVASSYKALAAMPHELGRLAREAYPQLFGVELPVLTPVHEPHDLVGSVRNSLSRFWRSVTRWWRKV